MIGLKRIYRDIELRQGIGLTLLAYSQFRSFPLFSFYFYFFLSKCGLLIKSIPVFSVKNKNRFQQNTCFHSTLNSVLQSCFSQLYILKGQIVGPCTGDFQSVFPTRLTGPLFLISLLVNAKLFCYRKSFMLILL